MWSMYLDTILKISSDNDKTEVYKRNLLRQSMSNAHLKNKLKPHHYIEWVRILIFFPKTILNIFIYIYFNTMICTYLD